MPPGGMTIARDVLRDYGNMSAATVLFVLERTLARRQPGRYLMSALGPGFSAGFQMIDGLSLLPTILLLLVALRTSS